MFLRVPEITSQCLGEVLARLEQHGVEMAPLLADHGLPVTAVGAPLVQIPVPQFDALFERAAQLLGDPDLGVHIAQTISRGTYGVVEFAGRNAPTLRVALARLVRYSGLLNDVAVYSVEEHELGAALCHRVPGFPRGLGRQGNEYTIAYLLRAAMETLGRPLLPQQVWLAHEPPQNLEALRLACGTSHLHFAQSSNGIVFAAAVLDEPISRADIRLGAAMSLKADAEAQALGIDAATELLTQVRSRIRERLDVAPNVERVAIQLGLSARTLQRRLKERGLTFQEIADQVRQDRARILLDDPVLELTQIARALGYVHPQAFIRAFKRWTGVTPGSYRSGS